MSKSASVSVTLNESGDGILSALVSVLFTNSVSPVEILHTNLTAGNNPQQAPNDASAPVKAAIVIPSAGSTNAKTLKGINGDTGFGHAAWTSLPVVVPVINGDTWVISSTGNETVDIYYV